MTYPHNPDLGFASRMYGHLTENWQFYGTAIGAAGLGAAALVTYYRQNQDLTERFGDARLPHKVKQQEAPYTTTIGPDNEPRNTPTNDHFQNDQGVHDAPVRLNAGWHDLTEQGGGFTPQQGVKYLWVVKEDGHLITGIEEPGQANWNAFAENLSQVKNLNPDIQANLDESVRTIQDLGHPTLAARFDGDALKVGAGRIGGELFQNDQGSWVINDHSGRYGKNRGDTKPLLENAAQEFRIHGVDVRHIQSKTGTDDQVVPIQTSALGDLAAGVSARINRVVNNIGDLVSTKLTTSPPTQPTMPNVTQTASQAPRIGGQQ